MKRNRLSMSFMILAGVIALSVLVGLPQAKADSYTLYAMDTATQNDDGITVYYGAPGDFLMIRTIPSSQGGNGFIKFDLSEIPDGSVVTNATLYLGLNSINEPPGDVGIYYGPNDNWSLNQLENPIGFDPNLHVGNFYIESGLFEFIPIALDPSVYDFQPDINDNALTLAIVVDDNLSNPGLYFYLEGSNDLTWRPYLVIDVTPGPVSSLAISPPSGDYVTTQNFDLTLIVEADDLSVVGVNNATIDGIDITNFLDKRGIPGTLMTGGETFRYRLFSRFLRRFFGVGVHTLSVTLDLSDDSNVSNSVTWKVKENTEP